METIYVTFRKEIFNGYSKTAVKCETEDQAFDVANDAASLCGISNIRLRRSGKPAKEFEIITPEQYFAYANGTCEC